ncbi:MAG: DUF898 family protein [Pseudobacteriovorax sp.]|nr:DUF898 family protein [Pseudobacteriovorax sp.]
MNELNLEHNPTFMQDYKLSFSFTGKGADLLLIMMLNLFLSIITLGLYYPWARTNVRRFLWRNTNLNGVPFEYTGTGAELFISFIQVILAYAVFIGLTFAFKDSVGMTALINACLLLTIFILAPYMIMGSFAYKATRTKHRGLSMHFDRSNRVGFASGMYWRFIALYFTFGIYTPWLTNYINKGLINETSFGDLKFKYSGRGSGLFEIQLVNVIFIILTLGLFLPWAAIRTLRYQIEHSSVDDAQFKVGMTGMDMLKVGLFSLLIPITVGIAYPFVRCYTFRKFYDSLTLEGELDFTKIRAMKPSQGTALGEASSDFFDLEFGF